MKFLIFLILIDFIQSPKATPAKGGKGAPAKGGPAKVAPAKGGAPAKVNALDEEKDFLTLVKEGFQECGMDVGELSEDFNYEENGVLIYTVKIEKPIEGVIQVHLEYFYGNYFSQRIISKEKVKNQVSKNSIKKSILRFYSIELEDLSGIIQGQIQLQKENDANDQMNKMLEGSQEFNITSDNIIKYTLQNPTSNFENTVVILSIMDNKKQIDDQGEYYFTERIFSILIKSVYFQKSFYCNLVSKLVVADLMYEAMDWLDNYIYVQFQNMVKLPAITNMRTQDMYTSVQTQYQSYFTTSFLDNYNTLEQIQDEEQTDKLIFQTKEDNITTYYIRIEIKQLEDVMNIRIIFFNLQKEELFSISRSFLLISMYNEQHFIFNFIKYYYKFFEDFQSPYIASINKSLFYFNFFDQTYFDQIYPPVEGKDPYSIADKNIVDFGNIQLLKIQKLLKVSLIQLYMVWREDSNQPTTEYKVFELENTMGGGGGSDSGSSNGEQQVQQAIGEGFKTVEKFKLAKTITYVPADEENDNLTKKLILI